MITQEYIKEMMQYVDEIGELTWKKITTNRVKIGGIIGSPTTNGYKYTKLWGKRYSVHRLVWLYHHGCFPTNDIDHIDGDRLNNRIENLREATRKENTLNTGMRTNNTSGYKGVSWNKRAGKWSSEAWMNGKKNYLGLFLTPSAASNAYNTFCKEHHGEFYRDSTA